MITNNGKNIISKYLLGQAPAYASYIAIGCGAAPLSNSDIYGDYSDKNNLDFEMFRVPISSRGFINENGVSKIVLSAEIPTEERYEITEVGIFSAASNSSAGAYDSKTIFAFTINENWQHHIYNSSATSINRYVQPLDEPLGDNVIAIEDGVFQTNAENSIFFNVNRSSRFERCRFLNNTILVRGDEADLSFQSVSGGEEHIEIASGSNHIHLNSPNVDFTQNSPIDELRFAMSVINKDETSTPPDSVIVLIEFASSETETAEFARFEIEMINGTGIGEYNFGSNRYYVLTKKIEDLYMSTGFTWDAVTIAKIYATVIVDGEPSSDYYVAFDALRLENVSNVNPLYGMTGYTVVKNQNGETVSKAPNTSNYIEFRFAVGVT
jgi:hypothetical protein